MTLLIQIAPTAFRFRYGNPTPHGGKGFVIGLGVVLVIFMIGSWEAHFHQGWDKVKDLENEIHSLEWQLYSAKNDLATFKNNYARNHPLANPEE